MSDTSMEALYCRHHQVTTHGLAAWLCSPQCPLLGTPVHTTLRTVWPSGLRRWLKAPFRKGVGSTPTAVTLRLGACTHTEGLRACAQAADRVGPRVHNRHGGCGVPSHTTVIDPTATASCPVPHRSFKTVWPSGLRRWLKAPFRKGVGSNPTAVNAL